MARRANSCTARTLHLVHPLKGHRWGTGSGALTLPPWHLCQIKWGPHLKVNLATPSFAGCHPSTLNSAMAHRIVPMCCGVLVLSQPAYKGICNMLGVRARRTNEHMH